MRLFAHNHLGPRVYASFENGLAYEYTAGKCLDYALAVDKNVYPLVAKKVGTLHRLMSCYVGKYTQCVPIRNDAKLSIVTFLNFLGSKFLLKESFT